MHPGEKVNEELARENSDLRARLADAEETLRAIREGEVDSLLISTSAGERIYTLEGADHTYRILVESMQQGAATLLDDDSIFYGNRHLARLLKTPLQQLIGESIHRFVPPDDAPRFAALVAAARQCSSEGELRLQAADGTVFPVYLAFNRLELGERSGLCLAVTDLTMTAAAQHLAQVNATLKQEIAERKRSDKALRQANRLLEAQKEDFQALAEELQSQAEELKSQAEELQAQSEELQAQSDELRDANRELERARTHLEAIVQQMPAGVLIAEAPSGRLIMGNTAMERIFRRPFIPLASVSGYDAAEAAPRESWPMQDHARLLSRALLAGESVTGKEIPILRGDDTPALVSASSAPIRDPAGSIIGAIVVLEDITERKQAVEALRISEERLRFALAGAQAGAWEWDVRTGAVIWSPESYALFGVDPARTATSYADWERNIHPDDLAAANEAVREALAGRMPEYRAEFRVLHPLRGESWVLALGRVGRAPDGTPLRMTGINIDITGRKRAELELARVNERLRALMDTLPIAVTIADDPSCRVITTNPAGTKLFAVAPGQNVSASAPPSEAPGHRYFHQGRQLMPDEMPLQLAIARDSVITDMEIEARLTDGRRWTALVSAAPLHDAQGRVSGGVAAAQDISEHKKMENMLKEDDRHKDEFLAMLAHELRNPLAPIRNAVQILHLVGANEQSLQRQRQIIDRQVTHMARLLDDLLDISRITQDKIVLKRQPLHLTDVLAHAIETTMPLVEARRHTLTVTMPSDDLRVDGDIDRLAQIVGNLLVNAAKYTDEGGRIWLEAALERGEAVIRVRDTGVGIAPEMLPRIFDLFIQVEPTLARTQGGLGIGLTMVKNLIRMHGGQVEAHSAGPGQGSEFVVRLPALGQAPAQAAAHAGPGEQNPALPATPHRILVVDDLVDTTSSLAELLGFWGHEVRMANNGEQALDVARDWRPEVVLLDIGMPGMDGYEVARRLRREHGDKMLMVALTGYAQESDREQTRQAGFNRHLAKPIDLAALRELLAAADLG